MSIATAPAQDVADFIAGAQDYLEGYSDDVPSIAGLSEHDMKRARSWARGMLAIRATMSRRLAEVTGIVGA